MANKNKIQETVKWASVYVDIPSIYLPDGSKETFVAHHGSGGLIQGKNGTTYVSTNSHVVINPETNTPHGHRIDIAGETQFIFPVYDADGMIGNRVYARLKAFNPYGSCSDTGNVASGSPDIAILEIVTPQDKNFETIYNHMETHTVSLGWRSNSPHHQFDAFKGKAIPIDVIQNRDFFDTGNFHVYTFAHSISGRKQHGTYDHAAYEQEQWKNHSLPYVELFGLKGGQGNSGTFVFDDKGIPFALWNSGSETIKAVPIDFALKAIEEIEKLENAGHRVHVDADIPPCNLTDTWTASVKGPQDTETPFTVDYGDQTVLDARENPFPVPQSSLPKP